jgi:hypothetical protein
VERVVRTDQVAQISLTKTIASIWPEEAGPREKSVIVVDAAPKVEDDVSG